MKRAIRLFLLVLLFAVSACHSNQPQRSVNEQTLSLGDTRIRPTDEMVMLYVPGGTFQMGSNEADIDYALQLCHDYVNEENLINCQRSLFENELPMHSVTLDGFWIDKTEVTNAQFVAFLNAHGSDFDLDDGAWIELDDPHTLIERQGNAFHLEDGYGDHPVVNVSWYGAAAYCDWVGARLPTEAEWAYAARGPESSRFPWSDTFKGNNLNYCDANCEYEWADSTIDDGYVYTAPVGSYPSGKSWCGALDMAGNVWEWLADWGVNYGSQRSYQDPSQPFHRESRSLRGGSWYDVPNIVRSTTRMALYPSVTWNNVGFRCARTAKLTSDYAVTMTLTPDTSAQVTSKTLAVARRVLQNRLNRVLGEGAIVTLQEKSLQVKLARVYDIQPVIQLAAEIGEFFFWDSAEFIDPGLPVPADARAVITRDDIENAYVVSMMPSSEWEVGISLTPEGEQKVAEHLSSNSGRHILVARDGVVIAPSLVRSPRFGETVLAGDLGQFRAKALVAQLNNEPLPFKLTVTGVDLE
jgi:formylglycine-generating enzyme required for sulfatase activity